MAKTVKRRTAEEIAASKKAEEESKAKDEIDAIYGDLLDMTERDDQYFPSGSIILDAVLSEGKGIPMGKFISINAESGCGKCVCGDTIINLNGVYQRIDSSEFSDGYTSYKADIQTLNGIDTTSHKYREKVNRIIKLVDQYGMPIFCTPDHPLLVLHPNLQEEWVKAKDIELKDKIIGQGFTYKKPEFDPEFYMKGSTLSDTDSFYESMNYNQLMSKIAGLIDKEDCVCNDTIRIYHNNSNNIIDLQKFLSMLGIVGVIHKDNNYTLELDVNNTRKLASLILSLVHVSESKLKYILQGGYALDSEIELHEVHIKEELEEPVYVYDYTIPKSHSFLANGLVSHNTTICLHIARNCCAQGYRCLYIDTECGLNRSQLESFSMVPFLENRTFIPKYIRTYRELDDLLTAVQKDKNLKFIFIDSLTDLLPDQFITNNISDINQPALEAVSQSRILKKFKYPLSQSDITVFFVLQNRTKIAMGYGEHTTVQAAGGKSVAYHMDITLELIQKEALTRSIRGHEKAVPFGSECYIKSNKNRHAPPKIPMLIEIIFGKGVSNSSAIANALLLNGTAKGSGKKYTVPYQGEEYSFLGKLKFEEFIKQHMSYYKQLIESSGGIKLIPDSEVLQPIEEDQLHQEEEEEDDTGWEDPSPLEEAINND